MDFLELSRLAGRFRKFSDGEKAVLKPVTLGYLTTDYAEVTQGLQEGDQVISEARGNLKDGSALSFLEKEEATFERAEPEVKGPEKK